MKEIYGPSFNAAYIWDTLVPTLPSNYDLSNEGPPSKMIATLNALKLMEAHKGKNLSASIKKKIQASNQDSKTVSLSLPVEFFPAEVDSKKKSKASIRSARRTLKGKWKVSVHKTYMFSGPKWDLYREGSCSVKTIFDLYPSLFNTVSEEDQQNLKGVFMGASVGICDHPYGWGIDYWDPPTPPTAKQIQTSLSNILGI